MIPLYFILLLASAIVPLIYSIIKIDLIKEWKCFFVSTFFVAVIFLIWDVIFTNEGIWGFNQQYCLGINFLGMPIEEYLFFFIIPFCSLFLHFAIFHVLKSYRLNKKLTYIFSILLVSILIVVMIRHNEKAYTFTNYFFLVFVLITGIVTRIHLLQQFYISFLAILVPFILVNGILTGIATDSPVVWYDHTENLGIRLFTIPIEDIGYAFTMLFGNLMIFETIKNKLIKV